MGVVFFFRGRGCWRDVGGRLEDMSLRRGWDYIIIVVMMIRETSQSTAVFGQMLALYTW